VTAGKRWPAPDRSCWRGPPRLDGRPLLPTASTPWSNWWMRRRGREVGASPRAARDQGFRKDSIRSADMVLGTRRRRQRGGIAAILLVSLLVVCAAPSVDEAQSAAAWRNLGANAQHTGLSASAAQSLEVIHWATPVDLAPPGALLIHYGSPL